MHAVHPMTWQEKVQIVLILIFVGIPCFGLAYLQFTVLTNPEFAAYVLYCLTH